MKKSNFKKFTLRLTSFVLVLVTVMSVMCVSLMSASAQSADEIIADESQVNYVTAISFEKTFLDYESEIFECFRSFMNALVKEYDDKYERIKNELKEQGYTKEDVVDYLMENYPEEVSFYLEQYTRIKEVLDEYGIVIDKHFFSL